MPEQRSSPYIWVTWLSKLLAGENSCEWASWFKGHYESWSYQKIPCTFDQAAWQMEHTSLLNKVRSQLEAEGKPVFTERQNQFTLRGSVATMGGKPDLIAISGEEGTVYDAKTGQPRASDHIQVMVYMYVIPLALRQYRGMAFNGVVVYRDHEVPIPPDAVNDTFKANLVELIRRLSDAAPAHRVASAMECEFCDITKADCSERVETSQIREGETSDF